MGVQEKGTGLKPESGKLQPPGVGETPPWTSNRLFPSLLQRGWMTHHDKDNNKNISVKIHLHEEHIGFFSRRTTLLPQIFKAPHSQRQKSI